MSKHQDVKTEAASAGSTPQTCSALEQCEGCDEHYSGRTMYTEDGVQLCQKCATELSKAETKDTDN